MPVISVEDVHTAGVLLREGDRYVFCFGPHSKSDGVYVLRIGGHREAGESPWECAVREAREEADVSVHQIPAPIGVRTTDMFSPVTTLPDRVTIEGHPEQRPLVVGGSLISGTPRSTLFLATTTEISRPSSEVEGLVILSPVEVIRLARGPSTFSDIEVRATTQQSEMSLLPEAPW